MKIITKLIIFIVFIALKIQTTYDSGPVTSTPTWIETKSGGKSEVHINEMDRILIL